MEVNAWVLSNKDGKREFDKRTVSLPTVNSSTSLVKPLAVGWEGNVSHAISREPIDINIQRKEEAVVLGNNGVVQLIKTEDARLEALAATCNGIFLVQPIFHNGATDSNGYLSSVFGYDMAGSSGLLSEYCVLPNKILMPLPIDFSAAPFWASYTIRYMTAWSVYHKSMKVYSAINDTNTKLNIVGWGGGTTLALLQLSALDGNTAIMLCGSEAKCIEAELHGVKAINTSSIMHEARKDKHPMAFIKLLKAELKPHLQGSGEIDIISDFVGEPTANASMALLGKGGVLATAGWKASPLVTVNRAASCIKQHTHVNCHHAHIEEIEAALQFGLEKSWCAKQTENYIFDDVLNVHDLYQNKKINSYFPVITGVNL
jgi:NADPH:quinone reductase-like Zn-dependent oxidoreductase